MSRLFTRDNMVLWILFAIAVLNYLETAGDPRTWDFEQWRTAASFVLVWVSGKLGSSPLPHSEDVKRLDALGISDRRSPKCNPPAN